jgi:Glycosyltransferase 61
VIGWARRFRYRLYAYATVRAAVQRLGRGYWRAPVTIRRRLVSSAALRRRARWCGAPDRFVPIRLGTHPTPGHAIAARRHRIPAPFATVIDDVCLVDRYAVPVTRDGSVLLTPFRGQIGTLSIDRHEGLERFVIGGVSTWPPTYEHDLLFSTVGRLSPNYFHWITEVCAQLEYVEALAEGLGVRPSVLVAVDGPRFQVEALRLIGWGDSISPWQFPRDPCRVRRFVACATPGAQIVPSPSSLRWLRDRVWTTVPAHSGASPAVYVSRPPGSWRTIVNGAELETALTDLGVAVVDPGALPLAEQVALFRGARVVIGQHGAGLTNVLFSRRAHLIEIVGGYGAAEYYGIASALDHTYETVRGVDQGNDLVVDVKTIATRVAEALS